MRLRLTALAIAMLAPFTALADDTAASPAAAAPTDAPSAAPIVTTTPPVDAAAPAATATTAPPAKGWKDLLTVDGLVDSFYQYNFSGANSLSGPTYIRNFDTTSNTFTLAYAKVGLGLSSEKAGFRLDMGYGLTGALINAAIPPGSMPTGPTAAAAFIVQQAYATLTPIDGLTIDFGKFVTTAGAEVIEANKNWLYSRSILFYNIPLLHNGLRVGYKINDMISVQGSLVNGWNGQGLDPDINAAKTVGLNASITLPMGLTILPTVYIGKETALATGDSTRILVDVVAAYTMDKLGLNFNFDFVQDQNAGIDPFWGLALMGHYSVSDSLNLTARGEYAQLKSGGTTTALYEGTVGVALPFSGHYELRPEFRFDGSDQLVFAGKKTQVTATLAALAYF
jgi:hypothetical protein